MSRKRNVYITVLALILVGLWAATCFAGADDGGKTIVPEAGSIALLSTGGFFGYLVRFARRRFQQFKRFFDIGASATGLVIASPFILLTAIFIKLVSPGSVFFKQKRVGANGEIFDIYKLRTMKPDAEKNTGPVWAQEDDPRLIKFGGFIRKAHIDELPQLVNVFKGQMSIIGPRPERPKFVEELEKEVIDYKKRLRVKPGITGLAQVRHKYDETIQDVRRKVKFDLLYIRRMCFWVDLQILGLTLLVVLTGKGAR